MVTAPFQVQKCMGGIGRSGRHQYYDSGTSLKVSLEASSLSSSPIQSLAQPCAIASHPSFHSRLSLSGNHKENQGSSTSLLFSSLRRPQKGQVFPSSNRSLLNQFLIILTFKMKSVAKIVLNITEALWGCTLDITDAYFHLPLSWWFQIFFAFVVDHQIYVFQYVPFGLSTAPWAFSRVVKPIKSHLHNRLIIIYSFLDNFCILHQSPSGLEKVTDIVLQLLQKLGFQVNFRKSILIPSQKIVYLGVLFHLDTLHLSLPEEKVQTILSRCEFTTQLSLSSRRQLESLVGLLNFASYLVPLGRLHLLPLISWMNTHTSTETKDLLIPLTEEFKNLLQIWKHPNYLRSRVPMSIPTPSLQLMTDASRKAWSGVLLPHRIRGKWSVQDKYHSTNWLELKAILLSLQKFLPLLQNKNVLIMTDNSTAVSCIRRQGSLSSRHLMSLTTELLRFCYRHNISLVPKHLSGNLNVLADQGSRLSPVSTEWSLDRHTFNWIWDQWGPFQVDLFATRFNKKIPTFISPCPDPSASGVNAFSLHWDRWNSIYLFPPTPIISEVVARLQSFQGRGVLIAPLYAGSGWFPILRHRARDQIPLPPYHNLSQVTAEGRVFHPNPGIYQLHVWIL